MFNLFLVIFFDVIFMIIYFNDIKNLVNFIDLFNNCKVFFFLRKWFNFKIIKIIVYK